MNDEGVLVTTDNGAHWTKVTPPVMRAQPVLLDHVDGIAAFGANRVWLLVSANAGYGTRLVYTGCRQELANDAACAGAHR